jgi:hypothetical protein
MKKIPLQANVKAHEAIARLDGVGVSPDVLARAQDLPSHANGREVSEISHEADGSAVEFVLIQKTKTVIRVTAKGVESVSHGADL